MLIEFDHAQDLAGSELAVRRFEKYRGLVFWKEKEIYIDTLEGVMTANYRDCTHPLVYKTPAMCPSVMNYHVRVRLYKEEEEE